MCSLEPYERGDSSLYSIVISVQRVFFSSDKEGASSVYSDGVASASKILSSEKRNWERSCASLRRNVSTQSLQPTSPGLQHAAQHEHVTAQSANMLNNPFRPAEHTSLRLPVKAIIDPSSFLYPLLSMNRISVGRKGKNETGE
jgi:hypothetical protein